jgi:ABC-type transporter Mla subunit MlaD
VEKKNVEIRTLSTTVQKHQENLKNSTAQTQRLSSELNDHKSRLGSTVQES